MKNTWKKLWNILSTVLVALIVLCAVFLMGARLIGYQCFTVLTGSMKPTYQPGDLIYVKQVYSRDIAGISNAEQREEARKEKVEAVRQLVEAGTLAVGDPVTFMQNETTVATHRIIGIDNENGKIYTKGDANDTEDSPTLYENIIGEVHFSIPKLGIVASYIQNPPGMYVTLGVGALLIVLVFLPDMFGKKKKEDTVPAGTDPMAEENERLKAELEKLRAEVSDQKAE